MQFRMLVLPAPLGPMMEVINPGSIFIFTLESAFSPPKESVTSEIVKWDMAGSNTHFNLFWDWANFVLDRNFFTYETYEFIA